MLAVIPISSPAVSSSGSGRLGFGSEASRNASSPRAARLRAATSALSVNRVAKGPHKTA